ncbi:bactofilin family protein [Treponema pectinovorum]|uniref:bactofilin family protein n=1 Tax=Treponema pectinovorum TaxID=164 RepID=UPI003D902393
MLDEKETAKQVEREENRKKNLTVLGQETEFDGVLKFTDNLIITGKFSGKIESSGDLEIEKSAICDVDSIKVNSAVISGKVNGNITALERVEMCSGSKIKGDIETGRIRIADDVDFEGQVTMIENPPEVNLFSVASDEFRRALVIKSDLPH